MTMNMIHNPHKIKSSKKKKVKQAQFQLISLFQGSLVYLRKPIPYHPSAARSIAIINPKMWSTKNNYKL